jgi:aspartyl-tRNA(Asn)/glutamyl-tRNA(Gln) amidotransferase subunit A
VIFAEHVPEETAEAVRLLEEAAYVNVGKANLHEFAYGVSSENPHYGTVPNPHAAGRVAGGSSGGSAAALVAGLADAALGSDSAGSIRIPAACCGVVGFKPSFGLVSLNGCFPLAPSFDHAGPMARDVDTCAEMMTVLAPGLARETVDLRDLHVGVAWLEHADPLVARRVEEAAGLFSRLRPIDLPLPDRRDWGAVFRREALDTHAGLFPERAEDYGEDVRDSLESAQELTNAEIDASKRLRETLRDQAPSALGDLDLIVTPTLPIVAPPVGQADRTRMTRFTALFNLIGWPALAVPCGLAEDGLPASVQLAAPLGLDSLVLAAGAALERALSLD